MLIQSDNLKICLFSIWFDKVTLFVCSIFKGDFLPPWEALSVRRIHSETPAHGEGEGFPDWAIAAPLPAVGQHLQKPSSVRQHVGPDGWGGENGACYWLGKYHSRHFTHGWRVQLQPLWPLQSQRLFPQRGWHGRSRARGCNVWNDSMKITVEWSCFHIFCLW